MGANYIKASGAAFRVHEDYGINEPRDLALENIAMAEGLLVTAGPLKGADGRLLRKKNRGIARISSEISNRHRRRFVIAHEFGHWLIHKTESQVVCTEDDMYDYRNNPLEVEANHFAAELLMPKRWFQRAFWEAEPSLKLVRAMAENFDVSLTSAALRFVELAKHPCLVVFSDGERVKWWRKSEKLPFWLQGGQRIRQGSVAWDAFHHENPSERMEEVEAAAWFEHADRPPKELLEDSLYVPGLGLTISLLWFPSFG